MNIQKIGKTLALVCTMLLSMLFLGWGSAGHKYINAHVVDHLSQTMSGFIQKAAYFIAHASDADNRKGGDSQKPYILREGPRHFMDIDIYPEFNNSPKNVPKDLSILIARSDSSSIFANGINPWAAIWTLDSLTEQIRRGDWQNTWSSAADLGHYVGDGHQPLHNTKDYDGKSSLPGSSGIHSRYETGMIDTTKLFIHKNVIQYVAQPIDFIFNYVYQANSYVDSIYSADLSARQESGYSGTGPAPASYYTSLWQKTGSWTQLQFQRATEDYADLLYTAWVNAGSPTTFVEEIVNRPISHRLDQNYPNPFNPTTVISYELPFASSVNLAVYDLMGRNIATLINGERPAGRHSITWNAKGLSSGLYFYKFEARQTSDGQTGSYVATKKLILLK